MRKGIVNFFSPIEKALLIRSLCGLTATLLAVSPPVLAETCTPVATLEALQGSVVSKTSTNSSSKNNDWREAKPGDSFCQGDMLKTSEKSRAAVRLINDTLIRLKQNSIVTFTEVHRDKKTLLELIQGAIHMMSRTPRPLEVKTPFVNAAIEGTEFVITAGLDSSDITVYEGQVRASSKTKDQKTEELILKPNQQGRFKESHKAVRILTANPRNAVAWTLYYPPIVDTKTLDVRAFSQPEVFTEILHMAENGEKLAALKRLNKLDNSAQDLAFHLIAASINLSLADLPVTTHHLDAARKINPQNGIAAALESIIAMVQNDLDTASEKVNLALKLSENSPIPWIALSYIQQARFKVPQALDSIREAILRSPNSARLQARLAEVELMNGLHEESYQSANLAVKLNPGVSLNQTILGFSSLKNLDATAAISAFNQAIKLNSNNPLSWLGLGLSNIRQNKLKLGRGNIETAAMLDPSNALLRSYLGKAYYEENRNSLSDKQFDLAKNLDPNDPTAWFYHSILMQSMNRPIEALQDQLKAIELNDHRGVYRSRQLLDQDEAARSVSLGRIYNDLGFEQLSAKQASDALSINFGNHSAHRLLADSYRGQTNRDAARLSELLQTQLLQPLNLMPIQPQLSDSHLGLLDSAGPGNLSYNEYNPMFIREGLFAQIDGIAGGQGTWGNDVIIAGLNNRTAFSLGQYHFETDGFGVNRNYEKDIFNIFGQGRLTEATSIQFEIKKEEETKGDVAGKFFADEFHDPDVQLEQEISSYRVGLTHEFSEKSKFLFSAIWRDRNSSFINPNELTLDPSAPAVRFNLLNSNKTDIGMLDIQHLLSKEKYSLTSGLSYGAEKGDSSAALDFGSLPCPFPSCEIPRKKPNVKQARLYSYINYAVLPSLSVNAGIALTDENATDPKLDDQYVLPKLGINWNITHKTRFNVAAFRGSQPNITSSLYQTLEPSQIAGFNQRNDEPATSDSWNYGLAIESQTNEHVSWGVRSGYQDGEFRDILTVLSGDTSSRQPIQIGTERFYSELYLFWNLNDSLVLSAEYLFNEFKLSSLSSFTGAPNLIPDGVLELKTHRLPVSLKFFHPSGLGVEATTTLYDQSGTFKGSQDDNTARKGTDNFVITDLAASYRLPKRRGLISLGINNLFNESFQFEDIASYDAFSPLSSASPTEINHERILFGKISFNFR